jgi:uncharacterized protein YndB with AHSA1/START domain
MTLRLTRVVPAPRDAVFRAWTDPAALARWWVPFEGMTVPAVEVDLRPGGRYRLTMRNVKGEEFHLTGTYREVRPPERLVYTWRWEGTTHDAPPDVETLVTVDFEASGPTTLLHLMHERLPDDAARARHGLGWNGVLDRLVATMGNA